MGPSGPRTGGTGEPEDQGPAPTEASPCWRWRPGRGAGPPLSGAGVGGPGVCLQGLPAAGGAPAPCPFRSCRLVLVWQRSVVPAWWEACERGSGRS